MIQIGSTSLLQRRMSIGYGRAKQRISLARRLARPAALFSRFLRFGDVLHLLDDVHLDALLALGAARGVPAHESFGLVGPDETALDAHGLALAGREEQDVAIPQQRLGARR